MTVKQTADKWGVSERWIQNLCENNRIKGYMRFGRDRRITADAEKPADLRLNKKRPTDNAKREEEGKHGKRE